MNAAEHAALQVEAVRDDPEARLSLMSALYEPLPGRPQTHLPYRRAALAFMQWELRRGLGDARVVRSFFTVIELVWDEKEALAIDAAAAAADRRTELQDRYDARLAAGAESTELTKLSAELRACEKAIVDMTAKISFDAGPAKSERHVRAARSRWDRRDAAWAAARGGA
jgi:hypothetical protein